MRNDGPSTTRHSVQTMPLLARLLAEEKKRDETVCVLVSSLSDSCAEIRTPDQLVPTLAYSHVPGSLANGRGTVLHNTRLCSSCGHFGRLTVQMAYSYPLQYCLLWMSGKGNNRQDGNVVLQLPKRLSDRQCNVRHEPSK